MNAIWLVPGWILLGICYASAEMSDTLQLLKLYGAKRHGFSSETLEGRSLKYCCNRNDGTYEGEGTMSVRENDDGFCLVEVVCDLGASPFKGRAEHFYLTPEEFQRMRKSPDGAATEFEVA